MHPRVRADLINHKFDLKTNKKFLLKLDELKWTLFPRWNGGSLVASDRYNAGAAYHLVQLLYQCDSVPDF